MLKSLYFSKGITFDTHTHTHTHTQKELLHVTFEHCFHRKSNYLWQFKFVITLNAHIYNVVITNTL